ncbi:uncharacterized protein LOC117784782 isoform X2 [Drosophila innubila]|uniref:uncharacterized protein LOC117784782 isoform X2 n=1 Tax=Drosophila innubila TaxID=198719 RepID=UPI00148E1E8B|nr:uncharacterized protein LOC117784782 isoform X2 [Drosophila innubila]
MTRLSILVITLALLTNSGCGSLTFWLNLLGLGMPMSPLPLPAPRVGLAERIGNRVSSRVDKIQDQLMDRMGGVVDKMTDRVGNRLDQVGETLTNNFNETVSKGFDSLPQLPDGLDEIGKKALSLLPGGLGNLLGDKNYKNDEVEDLNGQSVNQAEDAGNNSKQVSNQQSTDRSKDGSPNQTNDGANRRADSQNVLDQFVNNMGAGLSNIFG